jgi:hypothetical protein
MKTRKKNFLADWSQVTDVLNQIHERLAKLQHDDQVPFLTPEFDRAIRGVQRKLLHARLIADQASAEQLRRDRTAALSALRRQGKPALPGLLPERLRPPTWENDPC